MPTPTQAEVAELVRNFSGPDLTATLAKIEGSAQGLESAGCSDFLKKANASKTVLSAAGEMKRLAGQINVTIHALGILLCLPHILEDGERVEYVSLGAGNTGRQFDLETNQRIAEFKFIQWRGGPESIRQNGIFKDFFLLANSKSEKDKYLYVLGSTHPMKFFNGGRALTSVLSKDQKVRDLFRKHHGERFATVRDYYAVHQEAVTVVDMAQWIPELAGLDIPEEGAV